MHEPETILSRIFMLISDLLYNPNLWSDRGTNGPT